LSGVVSGGGEENAKLEFWRDKRCVQNSESSLPLSVGAMRLEVGVGGCTIIVLSVIALWEPDRENRPEESLQT